MPERSTISQHVQVGLETTEGLAVPANRQLQAMSIALSPQIETRRFRPTGTKVDTLVVPGKDWTQGDLSGIATYDEILYPLAGALVAPAAPTVTGTTGQRWTFDPSATTEDTVATLTVEQGSALRAHRAAGGILTDFGLSWTRDSVDLSGTLMAQQFGDGVALTATPTSVPLVPVLPKDISVYADPTAAALGTTKLPRALSGEFAMGGRFGALWTLNAALPSYAAHVETEPDFTLKLLLEADATGMDFLAKLRAGSSTFVRIEAVGGVIGAGPATYRLTWDMALKVEAIDSLDDSDGVYAIGLTMRSIFDATWGRFMQVEVVNSTTAL